MKLDQLKEVLKPLIKMCIKEVILEEGVLSNIIKETINGMKNANVLIEQRANGLENYNTPQSPAKTKNGKDVIREMMLRNGRADIQPMEQIEKLKSHSALGKLFEGTEILSSVGVREKLEEAPRDKMSIAANPLRDIDPNDPGVDLSIFKCFKY